MDVVDKSGRRISGMGPGAREDEQSDWTSLVSLSFEHVRAVSPTQRLSPLALLLLTPVAMTSLYKQAYSAFLNEKPRVRCCSVLWVYLLSDNPLSTVLYNRVGRDPHIQQL